MGWGWQGQRWYIQASNNIQSREWGAGSQTHKKFTERVLKMFAWKLWHGKFCAFVWKHEKGRMQGHWTTKTHITMKHESGFSYSYAIITETKISCSSVEKNTKIHMTARLHKSYIQMEYNKKHMQAHWDTIFSFVAPLGSGVYLDLAEYILKVVAIAGVEWRDFWNRRNAMYVSYFFIVADMDYDWEWL